MLLAAEVFTFLLHMALTSPWFAAAALQALIAAGELDIELEEEELVATALRGGDGLLDSPSKPAPLTL